MKFVALFFILVAAFWFVGELTFSRKYNVRPLVRLLPPVVMAVGATMLFVLFSLHATIKVIPA